MRALLRMLRKIKNGEPEISELFAFKDPRTRLESTRKQIIPAFIAFELKLHRKFLPALYCCTSLSQPSKRGRHKRYCQPRTVTSTRISGALPPPLPSPPPHPSDLFLIKQAEGRSSAPDQKILTRHTAGYHGRHAGEGQRRAVVRSQHRRGDLSPPPSPPP